MIVPHPDQPFFIAILTASVLLLFLLSSVGFILISGFDLQRLGQLQTHSWWFIYGEPARGGSLPFWNLGSTALAVLFCILSAVKLRSFFIKTSSPEVLFFIVFLLSFSLETLRAGIALLFLFDRSLRLGFFLSRGVYLGRFLGLLALLISGLFSIDMKYRNFLVLFGIAVLVSFAIAVSIPLDTPVLLANLNYKLGDEQGVWFVQISLCVITVATCFGAGVIRKNRNFFSIGPAFILVFAGRELLTFSIRSYLALLGLALFIAGTVLFRKGMNRIYPKE